MNYNFCVCAFHENANKKNKKRKASEAVEYKPLILLDELMTKLMQESGHEAPNGDEFQFDLGGGEEMSAEDGGSGDQLNCRWHLTYIYPLNARIGYIHLLN